MTARKVFAAVARKLLTGRRRRTGPLSLRKRLAVEGLEGRILPTIVHPGGSWYDNFPDTTVTVHNSGSYDIDVTGGAGTVYLSPAGPLAGPGDGSDDDGYTSYGAEVYGGYWGGPGSLPANAYWTGDAGNLTLSATGDVGDIAVSGNLYLWAGGNVGNVNTGGDCLMNVLGDVGNVSGVNVGVSGRNVGAVQATESAGVSAADDIESVTSLGNIYGVEAGGTVGPIAAGGNIGALFWGVQSGVGAREFTGSVTAGGFISQVLGGSTQFWSTQPQVTTPITVPVTAGTDIGRVWGTGILAPISAGHDISEVLTQPDTSGGIAGGGGIHASITAGNDIDWVRAAGLSDGAITAGQNISHVYCNLIGGTVTAGSSVGFVATEGRFTGSITAGQDVGTVMAYGGFAGSVEAGQDVYSVQAGTPTDWWLAPEDLGGSVTAGRDILAMNASGDVTGSIQAGRDVDSVFADDRVRSDIEAQRDVTRVAAYHDVTGTVTAGRDVGTIAAGWVSSYPPGLVLTGGVSGHVSAGRDVGSVTATTDITGGVTAGRDIGPVTAGNQSDPGDGSDPVISGPISAGRNIQSVAAYGGGVALAITAGGNVGEVFSTADIANDVTVQGSIHYVTARGNLSGNVESHIGGLDAEVGGDISGDLTAPGDITLEIIGGLSGSVTSDAGQITIDAGADVSGNVTAQSDIEIDTSGAVSSNVSAGDANHPADATITADGAISGEITASGSVTLNADGDVTGKVHGSDVAVTAGGDVSSNVTATDSSLSIDAGGAVTGTIFAPEDISVSAGGNVSSGLTSATSDVTVESQGDFTGSAVGPDGVSIDAQGDVSGSVTAGDANDQAEADVYAGGTVRATIQASDGAVVEAGADFTGSVIAQHGDVEVTATGNLTGAVTASDGAADITADAVIATVTARGTITVDANGAVGGLAYSTGDSITVATRGTFSGRVFAAGDAEVDADGGITGLVYAGYGGGPGNAYLTTHGSVTGSGSATGSVTVQADGDFDGYAIADAGNVSVFAWGVVAGLVDTSRGSAFVWGGSGVAASVQARHEVHVVSLGGFSGSLAHDSGEEEVFVLDGPSGEQELEGDLGETPDQVAALRQWYEALPSDRRQALNDLMASAWAVGQSFAQTAAVLQGASQMGLFWQNFATTFGVADTMPYREWFWNQSDPAQRRNWLARIGQGQGGVDSEVMQAYQAANPSGATGDPNFQQNLAAWDQQFQQESAQRKQQAQQLLQASANYDALEKAAANAWAVRKNALEQARRAGMWGLRSGLGIGPGAKTQEQVNLDNWWETTVWHTLNAQLYDRNDNFTVVVDPTQPSGYRLAATTADGLKQFESWKDASAFDTMGMTDKLVLTVQAIIGRCENNGILVQKVGGAVVQGLKDLIKPSNLAIMGGFMAGGAILGTTALGPVVLPVIAGLGYALLGKQAFDISQDLYLGVLTALDARSQADIDRAAERIENGLAAAAGAGTQLAVGAGFGSIGARLARAAKARVSSGGTVKVEVPGATATQAEAAAPVATAPARARLSQDVNVNPQAPDPLGLNRPIGRSPTQNAAMQADLAAAKAAGGKDFRVNQQQVNQAGQRVGVNRPDLQYTDASGRRVYIEYDKKGSPRGPAHKLRIEANDPTALVILKDMD